MKNLSNVQELDMELSQMYQVKVIRYQIKIIQRYQIEELKGSLMTSWSAHFKLRVNGIAPFEAGNTNSTLLHSLMIPGETDTE